MLTKYFLMALTGFLAGWFFLLLLTGHSLRKKLLIKSGMPLIGGVAIFCAFVLSAVSTFLLMGGIPAIVTRIILVSLLVLIFGVLDDIYDFSVWPKLLLQLVCALILIFSGVRTQIVYLGDFLNVIISLFWIVGITNAFNLLDIMDGLAGGCAMITGAALFFICVHNGDIAMGVTLVCLIAAVISFLLRNLPPARVYLGNSGSHFLGFVLSAIAIAISYAPMDKKIALLTPLLILWFPVFDTFFVSLMRIKQKKSAFLKSDDHLALRFLKNNFSKPVTLLIMLLLCLFFSLAGIMVFLLAKPWAMGVVLGVLLINLFIAFKMSMAYLDG